MVSQRCRAETYSGCPTGRSSCIPACCTGCCTGCWTTHHKLVRDRIPAIITADGGQPVIRVLDDAGYEAALRAKLLEEAHEAQAAPDGELASELADVLEVLGALAATHGMSWEDVVSEASRKRAERGGFGDRTFLEYVDQAP
ncbi:MAG: nucleoside triphosphate pyrophosphohydrolase [Streptosporangiaceae bacterium]